MLLQQVLLLVSSAGVKHRMLNWVWSPIPTLALRLTPAKHIRSSAATKTSGVSAHVDRCLSG